MNSASVHPSNYPINLRSNNYLTTPTQASTPTIAWSATSPLSPIVSTVGFRVIRPNFSSASSTATSPPLSRSGSLLPSTSSSSSSTATNSPMHSRAGSPLPLYNTAAWGQSLDTSSNLQTLAPKMIRPSSSSVSSTATSSLSSSRSVSPLSPSSSQKAHRPNTLSPLTANVAHKQFHLSPSTSMSTAFSSSVSSVSSIRERTQIISGIIESAAESKSSEPLSNIADVLLDMIVEAVPAPNLDLALVNKKLYVKTTRSMAELIYRNYIRSRSSPFHPDNRPDVSRIARNLPKYYQMMLNSYLQPKNYVADILNRTIPADILSINFHPLPLFNAFRNTNFAKDVNLNPENCPVPQRPVTTIPNEITLKNIERFQVFFAADENAADNNREVKEILDQDKHFLRRQLRYLFDQIQLTAKQRRGYPKKLHRSAKVYATSACYDKHLLYEDWHYAFLIQTQVILTRRFKKNDVESLRIVTQNLLPDMLKKMIALAPKDKNGKADLSCLSKHLNQLLSPDSQANLKAKMQYGLPDHALVAAQFEENLQRIKPILQHYLPEVTFVVTPAENIATAIELARASATEPMEANAINMADLDTPNKGCCIIS